MAKLNKLRSAAVGLGALVVASTVAFAAGLFPGFPIVGSASYCSSVAGTGSGTGSSSFPLATPGSSFGQGQAGQSGQFAAACNVSVPAGPSIITGAELIPADTALPSGQQPQTVLLSMADIGALPYLYSQPITGATLTMTNLVGSLIVDPVNIGLAGLTVFMPPSPTDGQVFRFSSSQTITGLVFTSISPITISNNPTALTTSTTGAYGYEFIYRLTGTKWFRLQ